MLVSFHGSSWEGIYFGQIEGTQASLTITSNSEGIAGKVDAGGYIYQLRGSIRDEKWTGNVTDVQTGVQLPFEAVRNNDQIVITVIEADPVTGQQSRVTYAFSKNKTDGASQTAIKSQGQIDQRLVGRWVYSESYGSGQFTGVAQWQMQLNADGTFWYGKGQFAGGGPGVSGSSQSDNVSTGRWKTEGKYIYVDEGDGWYQYAKYYVEGDDLMFTFDEDTREVWSR